MKFYTLDFDCNAPTAQQVNVPTNTDYKVGIKVKRNGTYQNLKPAEVKLYTGELSAIAPSEFDFADKEVLSGNGVSFLLSYNETAQTDISALYNQPVKCTDIYVESSTDNGVTWAKTIPSGPQYMRINDRSAGTNNYVAQKDLSDPDSKFELITGGYVTGTADEITLPSIVRFAGNFNTDSWQNTVRPCQMRLVIKYGGKTISLYISPDDTGINGYTTFTFSAGDNASYTQETLDIQHGYEAGFSQPAYVEQNNTGASLPVVLVSADLSDFVGKTIYPEDVYYSGFGSSRAEVSASQLDENFGPYWRDNDWILAAALDFKPLVTDKDGNAQIYMAVTKAVRDMYITGLGWPKDKPGFFVPGPNGTMVITDSYTVKEGDKIEFGKGYTVSNTRWYGAKLSITAGEPFDAKFKLNTNIFKSQQGDKAESVENASTAKLTGVYADGTEFDYDIVIA